MIDINLHNDSQACISGTEVNLIREHFSVENKAANFQRRLRSRFVKDRVYAITPKGKCDIGLVGEIVKYCKNKKIDFHINEDLFKVLFPTLPKPKIEYKLKFDLRDYQQEIVDKCINAGRGTIVLATAGGKTLTMAGLLEYYYQNVNKFFKGLIIVPDLGLVNQTHNDFHEYEVNYTHSIWSGNNELDPNTNIVVANMGILQSEKSDTKWLQNIDILIVDETHKLRRDNKINKIIKTIKTNHKFGFTGTLPDEPLDKWNIFGKIGPQLYERKAYELRNENYVTPAKVHILELNYKAKQTDIYNKDLPVSFYLQEGEFIKNNQYRNTVISKISMRLDNNTLILIDYIEHGEILLDYLNRYCENKKVFFICGDVEVDERRKIQQLMETETNIVVIAISKIFSTGINIKNLHYIIFANGGKAKIRIIQSIGRGLRLHKDKKQLIIFDIADNLIYGQRHVEQRKKLYDSENITYEQTNHFER
jgi:superfamily II DNA or RNA helicase